MIGSLNQWALWIAPREQGKHFSLVGCRPTDYTGSKNIFLLSKAAGALSFLLGKLTVVVVLFLRGGGALCSCCLWWLVVLRSCMQLRTRCEESDDEQQAGVFLGHLCWVTSRWLDFLSVSKNNRSIRGILHSDAALYLKTQIQ